jgi:hypothetical protein
MYDKTARISITQREYREAYRLHKEGKLRILAFVRSDVWSLRKEHKSLVKHLANISKRLAEDNVEQPTSDKGRQSTLTPDLCQAIAAYPKGTVTDAKFITAFINEVGRIAETEAGTSGAGLLPTGNWIHTFGNFEDIITTIQSLTFTHTPVEESAFRALVRSEIDEILGSMLFRHGGQVYSPAAALDDFARRYPLKSDPRDHLVIFRSDWNSLYVFAQRLPAIRIHAPMLNRALSSPVFLRFDGVTQAFVETDLYRALHLLATEIGEFTEMNTPGLWKSIFGHAVDTKPHKDRITTPVIAVAELLYVLYRWDNIVNIAVALRKHLEGSELTIPTLRPRSPIVQMQHEIVEERMTIAEIAAFAGNLAPIQE